MLDGLILLQVHSYLLPQLMFMLSHGFLQLGDLCLLLLNNTSQVFDAVVVRQLIFGHLQPAGLTQFQVQ